MSWGAVVLPLVAGALAVLPGASPWTRCRRAVPLAWAAAAAALGNVVLVAWRGSFGVGVGHGRDLVVGLWVNSLTATLALAVCGIGAVVVGYESRCYQSDVHGPRAVALTALVVAGMAFTALSADLVGLVAGWLVAGLAFLLLLGNRLDLPGTSMALRRVRRAFLIGDGALVLALVVCLAAVGDTELVRPQDLSVAAHALGGLRTPVALLIVMAALARCAQWPVGDWLPATIAAPTPTCALLHAGVVNGGGILLVRLGALGSGSVPAMAALLAVSTVTAVAAGESGRERADLKGSLAFSTMAQMGFMLAECAVGAWLAATVHLVGHACYKATLFLGSGAGVPRRGSVPVTAPLRPLTRSLVTVGVTVASVCAAAAVPGALAHRAAPVLFVFLAATTGALTWSWAHRAPAEAAARALALIGLVGLAAAYGALLAGAGRWLDPSLAAPGTGVLNPWWLAVLLLAGLAVRAVRTSGLGPALLRARRERPGAVGELTWATGAIGDVR